MLAMAYLVVDLIQLALFGALVWLGHSLVSDELQYGGPARSWMVLLGLVLLTCGTVAVANSVVTLTDLYTS